MLEMTWMHFTVLPALAYLAGSLPFGVLLARLHGVDLRSVGSGNVGATNVARALGKPWGYACFLLDFAKGFGPTLVARWLIGIEDTPALLQQGAWIATGMAAILGHVFPIWLKFRGGKGVATSLGVVVGIWPFFTWAGLASFGLWIVVTLASRYVSLGSVLASLAFLGFFAMFNPGLLVELWVMEIFAGVMAGLVIFRHRGNIRRLLAGTENRIGTKKDAP